MNGATRSNGPRQKVDDKLDGHLGEMLRELYVEKGLTLEAVGAEVGRRAGIHALASSTVMRWMDHYGIERRFPGQRSAEAVA